MPHTATHRRLGGAHHVLTRLPTTGQDSEAVEQFDVGGDEADAA
jgi:hypothetical protein